MRPDSGLLILAFAVLLLSGCQRPAIPGPLAVSRGLDAGSGSVSETALAGPEILVGRETEGSAAESSPGTLKIIAWNVESGMSNPVVIAGQLSQYQSPDLVVLTEVLPGEFDRFCGALRGQNDAVYQSVNGESGDEDRIEVIYNSQRLELLEFDEPSELAGRKVNTGRHRSPLVCLMQDRSSGQRFFVVAVHLARGNADFRKQQAIAIREWARDQSDSVLLIGDLNFDYIFDADTGNEAFVELHRDQILEWIRPEEMIDSNWYDENRDGADDYPGSLLDGAFVSGPAKTWQPACQILVRENDFPDDLETSDHRAIAVQLTPAK